MQPPPSPSPLVSTPLSFERVSSQFGKVIEWGIGLLLMGVVALNVINASGRYLFSFSFTGSDEIMVYALVFVVMAGAVLALAGRQHISLGLLPSYAGPRANLALTILHDLVALIVSLYVASASWQYILKIGNLNTKSMALGIPMSIPHSALFLGFAGMAAVALVRLIQDVLSIRNRDFTAATPSSAADSTPSATSRGVQ